MQCTAIAAGILGDANPTIELVNTFPDTKYRNLTEGQVDVIISREPFTMQEDVYEVGKQIMTCSRKHSLQRKC